MELSKIRSFLLIVCFFNNKFNNKITKIISEFAIYNEGYSLPIK